MVIDFEPLDALGDPDHQDDGRGQLGDQHDDGMPGDDLGRLSAMTGETAGKVSKGSPSQPELTSNDRK